MKRVALTENGNKTGQYFDSDKAKRFDEGSFWNGNNHISKVTGSQWNHEMLYLTASGKWVRNTYSQFQGSTETYEIITPADAAEWFVKNEYKDEEIPESLKDIIANLEV
jgi:hypothetical protein